MDIGVMIGVHHDTICILIQRLWYDKYDNMYLSIVTKSWRWVQKWRPVIRSTAHNLLLLPLPLPLLLGLLLVAEPKHCFVVYNIGLFSSIRWEKGYILINLFRECLWIIVWWDSWFAWSALSIHMVVTRDQPSVHHDAMVNHYIPTN